MPAHGDACIRGGRCALQSMSMVVNTPASKIDLGYWFEQLAAIGRASPGDGNDWAHSRAGYAHFRRGGWQYDVNSPDWPGSWSVTAMRGRATPARSTRSRTKRGAPKRCARTRQSVCSPART